MRLTHKLPTLALALLTACASSPDKHTLAELRKVEADTEEVRIEDGLGQAMRGYRDFLEQAPETALTPEAMRRLADLKVEKEYGILGDGELVEFPVPQGETLTDDAGTALAERTNRINIADLSEPESDFETRATGEDQLLTGSDTGNPGLSDEQATAAASGPLDAIELYDQILADYPHYENNDRVLYQKTRAYDELGRTDEAMAVMERLISEYPASKYIDEVQFRRAEYFFTRKKYLAAEQAYSAIIAMGESSQYYELALYKLGWTLYKQELHEEALHNYIALLDYKVSIGYDFDQAQPEADERRVADTYRVISLCFSNLGGPAVVAAYFTTNGSRSYEDRIYSHLGEFYFEKLRYHDAATVYRAFIDLSPLHKASPHFSMRVVEIYEAGEFPKLVLESKKAFAASYGLQSDYWRHFDTGDSPEVLSYLKSNLDDLATHYHALYQEEALTEERSGNYQEALHWYREYLDSFPADVGTPGVNYRLADLLLENQAFGGAALEYERTAYDYAHHGQAPAAGYAAIYAHREHQGVATGAQQEIVRRDAVTSTLRFVDAFPEHEHAHVVLGAAVTDLYEMNDFELAIATGHRLVESYPHAEPSIHRSAWAVIAHSSMDIAEYQQAEHAYGRVLEMTPTDDESRQALIDNLAASVYKQGEQANVLEDYRTAADHFLRIKEIAPTSEIRPAAEYDAGTALMQLEDWSAAAAVLESLRQAYPDHELSRDATRQIAFVFQADGQTSRAADEYERVAMDAEDPELRRESLLLAGELYEEAEAPARTLDVYLRYVDEFPEPIEIAVETRYKIAGIYKTIADEASYHQQLKTIVEIDAAAGDQRTPRTRYLAARSALVLSERLYARFEDVRLIQPFEHSLQEKQARMDAALAALERLVDYEVGEVTAAATFYIAEIYFDFSQSLTNSERPTDLAPDEMQDYEMVIEEEAYPFEEKAIEVHEKNLELMASGHFSPWVEKSLDKLADLMPGRYAKFEISSGFLVSIDSYAYRAPGAVEPGIDGTESETPPLRESTPAIDGEPGGEPSYDDPVMETAAAG